MNQPWIYMYSPSWSPLPPPSLPDHKTSFVLGPTSHFYLHYYIKKCFWWKKNNEAVGPKRKRCSVVDASGGESKARGCKNNTAYMNLSKRWEAVKDGGAWCAAVHGVAKCQTQLGSWKTTTLPASFPWSLISYIFIWCLIRPFLYYSTTRTL